VNIFVLLIFTGGRLKRLPPRLTYLIYESSDPRRVRNALTWLTRGFTVEEITRQNRSGKIEAGAKEG
jgi:hypothetical protein